MSNYRKTMAEALREMYPLTEETQIDEATMSSSQIARLKKAYEPMRDKKISTSNADKLSAMMDKVGKDKEALIQLFKADIPFVSQSAVTKLITKHNMKGAEINKLREEVDLDESEFSAMAYGKKDQRFIVKPRDTKGMAGKQDKFKMYVAKLDNKGREKEIIKDLGTHVSLDSAIKFAKNRKIIEDVDLDEATKQVLAHGGKGKYKVTKDGDTIEIKFGGKVVGTADFDRGADSFFVSIKGEKGQKSFDDAQAIADYFAKNKITEEVGLDEGKMNNTTMQANKPRIEKAKKLMGPSTSRKEAIQMVAKGMPTSESEATKLVDTVIKMMLKNDYVPEEVDLDEGKQKPYVSSDSDGKHVMGASGKIVKSFKDMDSANAYLKKNYNELMKEVDLDEGKMSQLHQYIKDKKSAEEIAKLMKVDVKTIKALMSSHHPEDVDEASAYADARRSMGKDKDFSRKDSADDDTDASADDVKGASKNIMMQMRKAQSLNGRFDVEFGDGKKVKIPAKMAIAVQQKYNAQKRPAEKEKFQAKIGKSYKDMLSALKEELQPQKESILERMNRKLKENKDG